VLAGLGLAGLRDFAAYLKYAGVDTALTNDRAEIKRAIGFGVSQSGRFLREFCMTGLMRANLIKRYSMVFGHTWVAAGAAALMSGLRSRRVMVNPS
jgi:hypothetical protein